jgi:hypothetical protein
MRCAGRFGLWHDACHALVESFHPKPRRTTMKFETLMLHSLFAACLLVCLLVLGAMLTTHATVPSVAGTHASTSATVHAAG